MPWEKVIELFLRTPPETDDKASPGWYCPAKFVPAYRDSEHLQHRYALTLDYDHIDEFDELTIFDAYAPYEHVRYTTFSHRPNDEPGKPAAPRWRVILPLKRPVTIDEFGAISRRVCTYAGIELASAETNAAAQFMFLPSVKHGKLDEWQAHHNKGAWLDPDAILATYKDWTDRKEWPHKSDNDHPHNIADKVDPRDKPDPIGLFCRTYSITAAIEKFELPYESTSNPDRWTYTRGSRPEGAVIYDDDTHLHSHHDTDPARGQNNAFDLVRLHLFSAFDDPADLDKPVTERPSYKAMADFCRELPDLEKARVASEFSDLGPLTEEELAVPVPVERLKVRFAAGRQLGTAVEPARRAIESVAEEIGVAVFGNRYVRPVLCTDRRGFDSAVVESVELMPYEPTGLAASMAGRIDFVRQGKPPADGGPVPRIKVDCPLPVAKALLVSADKSEAISIDRITMTPIMHEGLLHSRRGHSRELRAWIVAPEDIQPEATRAAAEAALKRVLEWLDEFPLDTPLDRSAAVCTLLTAVMRASVPHAPGTLVSKPDYGSGASTFCDLVHVVMTGRASAVVNASAGRAEVDKAIDAVQLAGLPCIVIDNVVDGEAFNSIALAQVLTQPSRQIRVLGESRVVTVPCTQAALVNGNNIKIADDLVRRFIRVRLDPHMESPHTRQFKRPTIIRDVQKARAKIMSDLYTIVLAYQASGAKVPTGTLAGFDEWSRTCVAPLVWLGLPDPLETQKLIAKEDEKSASFKSVLALWHKTYGETKISLARVFDEVVAAEFSEGDEEADNRRMQLKNALTAACQAQFGKVRAMKVDSLGVSNWLNGLTGRVIGGMCLNAEISENGKLWWVTPGL